MSQLGRPIYAHSLPDQPRERWETLDDHSAAVEKLAEKFAGAFGAASWGKLLGRWHDLGKRSSAFQAYIGSTKDADAGEEEVRVPGRVDHSTFGARHAQASVAGVAGQCWRSVSLVITQAWQMRQLPTTRPPDPR